MSGINYSWVSTGSRVVDADGFETECGTAAAAQEICRRHNLIVEVLEEIEKDLGDIATHDQHWLIDLNPPMSTEPNDGLHG